MLFGGLKYIFIQFLTWAKRGQRIKPGPGIVKVNLGSNLRVAKDWINIDTNLHAFFSKYPKWILRALYCLSDSKTIYPLEEYLNIIKGNIFVHHNLKYGIPFCDHSVDFIYASHLLEHLYKEEGRNLLNDAYRVIKKGGRIRICVPDLERAVNLYLKGEKEKALEYFFKNCKSPHIGDHRYMYDFELLKVLLMNSGFTAVEKCAYQEGRVPDIDKLDSAPEETLFVEATR